MQSQGRTAGQPLGRNPVQPQGQNPVQPRGRSPAQSQRGASASQTEQMKVWVPHGLWPGDQFTVEAPWGGKFEVVVPDGVVSGTQMTVTLPTKAAYEGQTGRRQAPPPKGKGPTMGPRAHYE